MTLVAETWSAGIAIELSTIIKKSGRDFRVFILEGNPEEWNDIISALNLTESLQFKNMLTEIYGDQILVGAKMNP